MLRFIRSLDGWQADLWQWRFLAAQVDGHVRDAAHVQEAEYRLELLGGKRAVEQARTLARTSTMTATQAIEHVRRNLANGYHQQHDERPVSGAGMEEM
jgi:hypothetical protein